MRVSGPEATPYLQGQLSQDVENLAPGTTAWTFVLQPNGKVDSFGRLTRTADDDYLLDVDGGHGQALVDRLNRFLLRTKAKIDLLPWTAVALRGPGAAGVDPPADDVLRLPVNWPGVEGADLLGPHVEVPPGLASGTQEEHEALRIAAGVPMLGAELTGRTIPAEAGQWLVDQTVSFTKGCFTGQELVARIDSRGGNVARHLRGLVVDAPGAPPPGAAVAIDGNQVGEVTSSAVSVDLGAPVALAYIARSVEPPRQATVTWNGEGSTTEAPAEIRALPLHPT